MPEIIRVIEVRRFRENQLLVTFSDGEKRVLSTDMLHGLAFAPLADEEIFLHPILFHGVITWKDGEIDIAPEYVYERGLPYQDNEHEEEGPADGKVFVSSNF